MKDYSIIIVGPQGSGKGTQAELLAKELKIPHISTGDIFRDIRNQDSDFGRMVKELIDNGKLVPDDVTDRIVEERLKQADAVSGFILDGYPRDLEQAQFLDSHRKIDYCILIDIDDHESMSRISARRICSKCKEGFNTIYIKPKIEGVCDKCQGKLIIRDDDKPEAVAIRLKKYHAETEPVLKHYEKKGVLVRINGAQEIQDVFQDILANLKL